MAGVFRVQGKDTGERLTLLKTLYAFESDRVRGAGSQHRDIAETAWTIDEAMEVLCGDAHVADLQSLLDEMKEQRQLLTIPETKDGPQRHMTRVGELVRRLGHTYEYWRRGRPTMMATEWLIEDKRIPKRDISQQDFAEELNEIPPEYLGPGPASVWSKAIKEALDVVTNDLVKQHKIPRNEVGFSRFQVESTKVLLRNRLQRLQSKDPTHEAHVLSAGVGSGKTLGFTLMALIDAVWNREWFNEPADLIERGTHLFVYPRTELARDQAAEIERIARGLPNIEVWFEHSSTYSSTGKRTTTGVREKYPGDGPPPAIIITTFETLKRRMRRPEFIASMARSLNSIVVDEVHLLSGIAGSMAAALIQRLAALGRENVHFVGSSATIARPDEHAGQVFGVESSKVCVVTPSTELLDVAGLNHHVFCDRRGRCRRWVRWSTRRQWWCTDEGTG